MERFDVNYEQRIEKTVLQDKCNGDISKFRQEYPSDPEECFSCHPGRAMSRMLSV